MTYLKMACGLLLAAAMLIYYLATSASYDKAMSRTRVEGRVVRVTPTHVEYRYPTPIAREDRDGDGLAEARESISDVATTLRPGDTVVVRGGRLELAISRPTPLSLFGFFLSLALTAWFWWSPRLEARRFRAAQEDPLTLVAFCLRKTRSTRLTIAVWGLVAAGFLFGVLVAVPTKLFETAIIGAIAGGCVLGALYLVSGLAALIPVERAPVMMLLRDQPEHVFWVYEHVVRTRGFDQYNVFVGMHDGTKFRFNLQSLPARPLLDALGTLAPQATVGYTYEHEQAWRAKTAA